MFIAHVEDQILERRWLLVIIERNGTITAECIRGCFKEVKKEGFGFV